MQGVCACAVPVNINCIVFESLPKTKAVSSLYLRNLVVSRENKLFVILCDVHYGLTPSFQTILECLETVNITGEGGEGGGGGGGERANLIEKK